MEQTRGRSDFRNRGGRGRGRGKGRGRGRGTYDAPVRDTKVAGVAQDNLNPAWTADDSTPFLSTGAVTPATPSGSGPSASTTATPFSTLNSSIHPLLLSAIPHPLMTAIQSLAIPIALDGKDLMGRAKTGEGKTLAFLIPAIQQILKKILAEESQFAQRQRPLTASILILSPTRELALQTSQQASILLTPFITPSASFPHPLGVQHVLGGTNISSEVSRLRNKRSDVLVATPGRLIDHLTREGNDSAGLREKLQDGLEILILDEADRLLDQGFKKDIERILSLLPSKRQRQRQTMMFSATVSDEVGEVAEMAFGDSGKLPTSHQGKQKSQQQPKSYEFVSTVLPEDEDTHERVTQYLVRLFREGISRGTGGMGEVFGATLEVIEQVAAEDKKQGVNPKLILFYPTARAAALAHKVFEGVCRILSEGGGEYTETARNFPFLTSLSTKQLLPIHSRMSQSARLSSSSTFSSSLTALLFSSDVTARGMDFPDVSCVIQVGLPANREQYIHRLGRTGRAGKEGRGVIILGGWEDWFVDKKDMKDLPIENYPGLIPLGNEAQIRTGQIIDAVLDGSIPTTSSNSNRKGKNNDSNSALPVTNELKGQGYSAWLGFYKGSLKNMNSGIGGSAAERRLIEMANEYARDVLRYRSKENDGDEMQYGSGKNKNKNKDLPPMPTKTIGMMGLSNHRDLFNLVQQLPGKAGRGRGHGPPGRGRGG